MNTERFTTDTYNGKTQRGKNKAACNCMTDEEFKMKKGMNTNSMRRCNDNTQGPWKLDGGPKTQIERKKIHNRYNGKTH